MTVSRLRLSRPGLSALTVGLAALAAGPVLAQAGPDASSQSATYVRDSNGFSRATVPPPAVRYVDVLPGSSFSPASTPDLLPASAATARTSPNRAAIPPSSGPPTSSEVIRTVGPRDRMAWVQTNQAVTYPDESHVDRLSVRQQGWLMLARGGPELDGNPAQTELVTENIDVRYTRAWNHTLARSEDGMELAIEPHAGVEIGSQGGAAVAGATLRLGRDLDDMVADGSETFGDRQRWYVFAAGSGRAVGYNWARSGDGSYARSGMSQDEGTFVGDATLGVAVRRGAVQGSVGVVYREVEIDGLRGINGMRTDVGEGVVGFQLSIKP